MAASGKYNWSQGPVHTMDPKEEGIRPTPDEIIAALRTDKEIILGYVYKMDDHRFIDEPLAVLLDRGQVDAFWRFRCPRCKKVIADYPHKADYPFGLLCDCPLCGDEFPTATQILKVHVSRGPCYPESPLSRLRVSLLAR